MARTKKLATAVTPNKFGGFDTVGSKGVARTATDDTETLVYVFSPTMTLIWRAVFSAQAPNAAVDFAIKAALREVA